MGNTVIDPGAPASFAPPAPPAQSQAGKGLAITALILGIISLLLCWVPIVNNLVFFLGFLALVLGVIAMVIALRRRSTAKAMSIIAVAISVLSLIGVFATQAMYVSMLNSVSDSISDSIEEASDGVVPVAESDQKAADSTPAKAMGESAQVGDYSVTVNSIALDGAAEIMAANPFNDAPTGQYVLVDLTVSYNGAEEGNPWLDLGAKFVGSDARQYDPSTCMAVVPKPAHDVPTLEQGGTGTYQLCMDVPAEAVTGAKFFIEPTFSFSKNDRVYWSVG